MATPTEKAAATPEPEPVGEKPVAPYRLKLSSNQKKRSRLQQVEESPPDTIPSVAAPETAPPPPPLLRKVRLKRSGQMHDDLTKPLPEENSPPVKPDAY